MYGSRIHSFQTPKSFRVLFSVENRHSDMTDRFNLQVNYVKIDGYMIDRFNVQIMYHTTPSLERCQVTHTDEHDMANTSRLDEIHAIHLIFL